MTKFTALCAILAITAATPALAFGGPEKKDAIMQKHFEMVDTNKDGKISEDESEKFAERKFKEADANGDGYITQAEAKAQHEKEWSNWKDKKGAAKDTSAKKAHNANPTDHSENSTNPAQKAD